MNKRKRVALRKQRRREKKLKLKRRQGAVHSETAAGRRTAR